METLRAADPDVHVWDGVVWMYCSQDQPPLPGATELVQYSGMDGYHVFSSTDLVNGPTTGKSSIPATFPGASKAAVTCSPPVPVD